jgi:anti-sigma B factor antagonist
MSFSFDITTPQSCTVIHLQGKIMTEPDTTSLSEKINDLIDRNNCQLIFNATELAYINSAGINLFMKTLTKTRVNNGDLLFYGVRGSVANLFNISKLNKIYSIYSTEEEAIKHFKNRQQ